MKRFVSVLLVGCALPSTEVEVTDLSEAVGVLVDVGEVRAVPVAEVGQRGALRAEGNHAVRVQEERAAGLLGQVEDMVLEEQVVEWLTARATVTQKPTSFQALVSG